MIIRSDDGTIELNRGSFDDPADLDINVESQGFSDRASNIFPTSSGEFFSQVRAIEQRNEGRAVLSGTEDFELVLEMPNGNGAFWVEVRVCAGYAQPPAARVLRCRMHVDGEHWSSTVAGLKRELGLPPQGV